LSNEITLEALLQANAGTTIGNFVPDDRLQHTIENIRNGDIITEELLTDLKNRQDDTDTVITTKATELSNIYLFGGGSGTDGKAYIKVVDETNITEKNAEDSPSTFGYCATLVFEDENGDKLFESRAIRENALGVGGINFDLMVSKQTYFTHVYIYYYDNGNFEFVRKTAFESVVNSNIRVYTPNAIGADPSITYNGRIGFSATSNYTTLVTTRIQAGQLVDELDGLIQTNEIDFNDRTKLILEYTKK